MIRGTTPRLEFTLPFETGNLDAAWVTIAQNKKEIINKELAACKCEGCKLSVDLTQEDTLKLDCSCKAELQVRVKTRDGEALASEIIRVDVDRILKDGAI